MINVGVSAENKYNIIINILIVVKTRNNLVVEYIYSNRFSACEIGLNKCCCAVR